VYYDVIMRERQGAYLGKTVQVIPHITDEIKRRMRAFEGKYDIIIIEIGGTVGDIESLPFLEACRQLKHDVGSGNAMDIHLTYVPYIKSAGELKTKPTQHSVKTLMEFGIMPDVLLCRAEVRLGKDIRSKIALFCNVEERSVIEALDAPTIYEVPMLFARHELDTIICEKLRLKKSRRDLETWSRFVHRIKAPRHRVEIAFVGKYNKYPDSYKSILEALTHAGAINNTKVNIRWIDSEEITSENVNEALAGVNGILVAPGFGHRGIEGKISCITWARTNNVPFFGICLGMQCAVIEYARSVLSMPLANSSEFKKNRFSVIDLLPEQRTITDKGGTMRLGAYPCHIERKSRAFAAYKSEHISERHRHRYEFNNDCRQAFTDAGMKISGTSPDGRLVEIVEIPTHRWFVGVQFHPELKSRAVTGHPLFVAFIKAACSLAQEKAA
jgi:CTP synthase